MPIDVAEYLSKQQDAPKPLPPAKPAKGYVPPDTSSTKTKGIDVNEFLTKNQPKSISLGERAAPIIQAAKDINRALSEQTQEQVFGPIADQFAFSYLDFLEKGREYHKGQGTLETLRQGALQVLDVIGMTGLHAGPIQKAVVDPIHQEIQKIGEKVAKGDKYTQHDFDTLADMFDAAYWTAFGGIKKAPTPAARAGARVALQDLKETAGTAGEKEKPVPVSVALDKTMGFQKIADVTGKELHNLPVGTRTTAGELVDKMIPHSEGYAKSFLTKLREQMDEKVPVTFKAMAGSSPDHLGVYFPELHQIEIKAGSTQTSRAGRFDDVVTESGIVHTAVHEIVHSTTVHMMNHLIQEEINVRATELGRKLTDGEKMGAVNKPRSPVLRELDAIISETRVRAQKAGRQFYGLDPGYKLGDKGTAAVQRLAWTRMGPRYEFIAELFSNADFQEFLANSEKYASAGYKWKNMLNQFGMLIGRHLGLKGPHELQLLNQSMRVGSQLIKLSSETKPAVKGIVEIVAKQGNDVITRGDIARATEEVGRLVDRGGVRKAKSSLTTSLEQFIRTFNPEALGYNAKLAASLIASRLAELEQKTSAWHYGSAKRAKFWRYRPDLRTEFVNKFEKGENFSDPILQKLAKKYREWGKQIFENDQKRGFDYEERANYLFHSFEDSEGLAAYFNKKYGSKWGDPSFTKERSFDLYSEAIAAGFKPRFENPEDIMLARQHASDVAEMHTNILNDLASFGLATRKIVGGEKIVKKIGPDGKVSFEVEKIEGTKQPENTTRWRSPTGDVFWVDNQAQAILHNAFESKSLWGDKGVGGMVFRGGMELKNRLIPIRLAVSLFHPLHVAGIDIAANMVRAEAELLSGKINPIVFTGKMLASGFSPIINTKMGWRVLKAWRGQIEKGKLTAEDAEALKILTETGISPELSNQYRTNARQNFAHAWQDAMGSFRQVKPLGAAGDLTRAAFHLPWAMVSAMGKPIFEQWIPALKAASAIKDAQSWLERNPQLAENEAARRLAMRRIGKSVENRYGEMAYNKLFWQRWSKDLAVLNTLSLGWQLGFLREYGGGALDLGQFAKGGEKIARIRRGELDKVLFVANYTGLGMGLAGLMTFAFTGEMPTGMDYVNPRIGGKNPDGTDKRVTTMFYSREFASLYKHIQNEGLISGVSDLVLNKGSGMVGLVHEMVTGMNQFGQQFRDPNSDIVQQTEQSLAYALSTLEPISRQAIKNNITDSPGKEGTLSVLGFTPEPKYMTETVAAAHIKTAFRNFVAPKETPFEKAEYSREFTQLRKAYQAGSEDYPDLLDKLSTQFNLSGKDQRRIIRSLNSPLTPELRMFISLGRFPEQQKKLLDEMSPEERDVYLPHANKEKVRRTYIPPEDRQQ